MIEDNKNNQREPAPLDEIKKFHKSFVPSAALKARILKALKEQQLITYTTNMKKERFYWIAATITAIFFGFFGASFIQSVPPQAALTTDNQFLLLLHEDSTFIADENDIPKLINEYTAWAVNANKEGKLVAAEKLMNESTSLGKVASAPSFISGYFVIKATTLTEAVSFANTHPHLKYNGGIEVRPIEKLN